MLGSEGRHQEAFPYVAQHQKLLEDFLGDFWDFYRDCWPTGSSQPLARGSGWRGDLTPCSPPRRATGHWTSGLG